MLVMVRIKPSKIWYVLKSRPVPKSTCLDHHPTKKLEIDHQTFQFNHRIPGSKLEENSNDKTQRRPAPTKTGRFWIIFAADTKSPGSSRVHLGCINLIPYSLSVGRGYNLYNQRLIGSLPIFCGWSSHVLLVKTPPALLDHCWIPTNERSAAAPLWRTPPFAGDSGNLHRLHGVFMQKNEVLRGLATKNERLYTQNWFGNPSVVAHGQPDFDPCVTDHQTRRAETRQASAS